MVTAFNPGIVWSENAISKEVQEDLRRAVLPLEQVPEEEKDYHPGSDQRVVDLVHPSLFPVVYGRTKILRDEILTRDGFLSWTEKAETLPRPSDPNDTEPSAGWHRESLNLYSTKFQWLPCDVEFGKNDEQDCRIVSYINNLHPQKHKDLYQVIEKVITKTIPLWDQSLHEAVSPPKDRIPYESVDYLEFNEPEPEWDEDHPEIYNEWQASKKIVQPEPQGDFQPLKQADYRWGEQLSLRNLCHEDGLQVIVKLANIELTPDKPRYEGGTWHVEGQLVSLPYPKAKDNQHSPYCRMNTSVPRQSTTTLPKTSLRVHFHSEHERILIRLKMSITSKIDMSFFNKFMALDLKLMEVMATAPSPKILETYLAVRAASSLFLMCYSTVLPPLNLPTKPSRDIARSLLCFLLIHISESFLQQMCHLRERTGWLRGSSCEQLCWGENFLLKCSR